jgi:hypothetical protein
MDVDPRRSCLPPQGRVGVGSDLAPATDDERAYPPMLGSLSQCARTTHQGAAFAKHPAPDTTTSLPLLRWGAIESTVLAVCYSTSSRNAGQVVERALR